MNHVYIYDKYSLSIERVSDRDTDLIVEHYTTHVSYWSITNSIQIMIHVSHSYVKLNQGG